MNNRKETFKNINLKGGNRTKKNNGLTSKVETPEQTGGTSRTTTQQAKTFINLISQGKDLRFDNTFKNIYAEILTNNREINENELTEQTIVFDNGYFPTLFEFIKNTNLKLDEGENVKNVKIVANELQFNVNTDSVSNKDINNIYINIPDEIYSSINSNNDNNPNKELQDTYEKLTEYILTIKTTNKSGVVKHNPSFNLLVLAQVFLSIVYLNSNKYTKPENFDKKIDIDYKKQLLLECAKALLRAVDEILTKGKTVQQDEESSYTNMEFMRRMQQQPPLNQSSEITYTPNSITVIHNPISNQQGKNIYSRLNHSKTPTNISNQQPDTTYSTLNLSKTPPINSEQAYDLPRAYNET